MCVIAYVEKDRTINKKELESCFLRNPDGAGFMYQTKKGVHIKKGFMNFKDFWEAAKDLPSNVDRVFHFRIATSGKVSTGVCHPFEVCTNYQKMTKIDSYCTKAMAHNGILTEFAPPAGLKAAYSDTMKFNKEVIEPLHNTIFNEKVQDMIVALYGCKYAIMDKTRTAIIGDDWVQSSESGIMYSNSSYKSYNCAYGTWYGYGSAWGSYPNDDYYSNYQYDALIEVHTGGVLPEHQAELENSIIDKLRIDNVQVYDTYWDDFSLFLYIDDTAKIPNSVLCYPIEVICDASDIYYC